MKNPTTTVAAYQKAAALLQQGDTARAEKACEALLARQPRQPDVLHLAALVAKTKGDAASAERFFRASLAARRKQPAVMANLANLLKVQGRTDEALVLYKQAVGHDPAFVNGWYGLALTLYENGQHAEAATALKRILPRAGKLPALLELHALIQWRLGDVHEARKGFEKALQTDNSSSRCWFNYGNFLREAEQLADAVSAYRNAIAHGLRTEAVYLNLAEVLSDMGDPVQALDAFDEALHDHPLNAHVHYLRAKFCWESSASSATHLSRLESSLATHPDSVDLWGSYFDLLSHEKSFDKILERLPVARRNCGEQLRFLLVDAVTRSAAGEMDRASELYEELLGLDPESHQPRLSFAEHLLKCRDFARSAELYEHVLKSDRYNQRALAFLSTAWQQLGDERWQWLVDPERSIKVYDMEPPQGFSSLTEFLGELASVLHARHGMSAHPLDQTLRGGTQTNGFLFRTMNKTLLAFEKEIHRVCAQHVQAFPESPEHPFWERNTGRFELKGAWSVRLRAQGFHTNHFHSQGWISSACYVSLPKEIGSGEGREGYIQFGVPSVELGLDIEPFKVVKPQEGRIVLFPSYMWHGTLPFESEQPRLTAAFDVAPL